MTAEVPRDHRLYLSPPDIGPEEINAVTRALESGWVAPLGPEVDAFEREIAAFAQTAHAVALSSGTAALHLGLMAIGVKAGDEVIVPTMTFGATAFSVTYLGAQPVFMDIEEESWNLHPDLLEQELADRARSGRLPAAVISVDLFGTPCNYELIVDITTEFGVPLLCDAAESLGAMFEGRPVGGFGRASVFSFNGNKIMTTSGGGMLVTNDKDFADRIRYWSTQSRESLPWYEHRDIGFNYRMSNVLAALGRAQLSRLPTMIARRHAAREQYRERLGQIPGVQVMGDPRWGQSNAWLTCIRFDSKIHPGAASAVRTDLDANNIEGRPVWKPMHQQPVFSGADSVLIGMADRIFDEGLCLPSGSAMSHHDVLQVCDIVESALDK